MAKTLLVTVAVLMLFGLGLSGILMGHAQSNELRQVSEDMAALLDAIDGIESAPDEPVTYPSGTYGFANEVWFSQAGYTPHYAEHVIDPLDGREKLVMADPHTRQAVFVYDLYSGDIEFEFEVPGDTIPNPHAARMLMKDVAGFGKKGDIYCVDRDQRVIVINRQAGEVVEAFTISEANGQWDPGWLHDACLSVDSEPHLILSDYNGPVDHTLAKYRISDGSLAWNNSHHSHPGKIMPIEGAHAGLHTPDYGGDYLICVNEFHGSVWEIKDGDGSWTWARPRDGQGPPLVAPHSAFRMGRVENAGWVTVVGTEGGGGIMAVHFTGAPLWGIGNRAGRTADGGGAVYTGNVHGLAEVTHVFPTLDGRIGLIDWGAVNRANVVIMNEIPQKQHVSWRLDHNRPTADEFTFLEYVPVADWDETHIVVMNTGDNDLEWKIMGGLLPASSYAGNEARPDEWIEEVAVTTLAAGEAATHKLSRPYQYILIEYRAALAGSHTTVSTYFDHLRR